MMINKRLIGTVSESKKYIAWNVVCQWFALAASIAMMGAISHLLQSLYAGNTRDGQIAACAAIAIVAAAVRIVCATASSRMACGGLLFRVLGAGTWNAINTGDNFAGHQ